MLVLPGGHSDGVVSNSRDRSGRSEVVHGLRQQRRLGSSYALKSLIPEGMGGSFLV